MKTNRYDEKLGRAMDISNRNNLDSFELTRMNKTSYDNPVPLYRYFARCHEYLIAILNHRVIEISNFQFGIMQSFNFFNTYFHRQRKRKLFKTLVLSHIAITSKQPCTTEKKTYFHAENLYHLFYNITSMVLKQKIYN